MGRSVHWVSSGFTPSRLVVVGFVCVNSGASRGRRVHSDSRGFARRGRRVHSRSHGFTQGSSRSFGIAWVHPGAPRVRRVPSVSRRFSSSVPSGRCVYSCSHGFIRARIAVVGFIRVRVCSLGRDFFVSSGSFRFAWVH